jgi:hypothetical protein
MEAGTPAAARLAAAPAGAPCARAPPGVLAKRAGSAPIAAVSVRRCMAMPSFDERA